MTGREQLHDLRHRAHDAGIQGASKMTEQQLKDAMKKIGKGAEPMVAKRAAGR